MIKETTQSRLEELKRSIEHFDPKEWSDDVTLERLRNDYEMYKDVADTLTLREMRLIALLRGCRIGDEYRFVKAAEQLYVALQSCASLGEITPPTATGYNIVPVRKKAQDIM